MHHIEFRLFLFTFLETNAIFAMKRQKIEGLTPKRRFRTVFTEDVMIFLSNQDIKARQKILANIRKAEVVTDQELFKKLTEDIWEFGKGNKSA